MDEMIERRRTPRVELSEEEHFRFDLKQRVRLMDISQTGALVSCGTDVPVGARGQIRLSLDAAVFTAEVAVRRRHPKAVGRGQLGLGTMFGAMDERSKKYLEVFLQRAKD